MEELKINIDHLPSDWTVESLVDIVDSIDYGVSQAIPKVQPTDGIKIVSTADINRQGQLLYQKIRRINVPKKTVERLALTDGDVLFNWRNSAELIGKTTIFHKQDEAHIFASFILRIRCDEERTHNYFLKYLLNYYREEKVFIQLARRAVNQANYNKNEIGVLKVPFPKVKEQRKIAYVLNTIQKAIEQQDKLIKATTELKKALMQKLFTEGTKGEKQKQTEIGLVPESWEVIQLGKVADVTSGGTPSRTQKPYWEKGTIPWVKTGEIDYCVITEAEEYITEEGYNNSSARMCKKGTLLMAMYGQGITRGKVAILGIDATINQACAAIIPKNEIEISTDFLYYFFEHNYEFVRNLGHGANQKNLSGTLIKGIEVSYPKSSKEQSFIVNSLRVIDNKIQITKRKKRTLSDLLKTLLHELMTGQRRVHELEFEIVTKEYTIEQEPLSMVAET